MVDLDVLLAVSLNGLGFGQASCSNFGMGEDYRRNQVIVEMRFLEFGRSEKAVSELSAGSDRNGCEFSLFVEDC